MTVATRGALTVVLTGGEAQIRHGIAAVGCTGDRGAGPADPRPVAGEHPGDDPVGADAGLAGIAQIEATRADAVAGPVEPAARGGVGRTVGCPAGRRSRSAREARSDSPRDGAGLTATGTGGGTADPFDAESARAGRAAGARGADGSEQRIDRVAQAGITAELAGAAGARVAADRLTHRADRAPRATERPKGPALAGRRACRQRSGERGQHPQTARSSASRRGPRAGQARRCWSPRARAMLSTITVFASAASPHPISLTHLLSSRSL